MKFQAIFKAGFEIDAKNEREARRKAKLELAKELIQSGASFFLLDIERESL
jgi:hypothetical protein